MNLSEKGGFILVCEEDDSIRKLIYTTLHHAGFQVSTARYGDEAIAKIKSEPHLFDATLTDVVVMQKTAPTLLHLQENPVHLPV